MGGWLFSKSDLGEIDGLSNSGLEWYKDDPIPALAREICQNSLDAGLDNGRPVRVEFESIFMKVADFPGMAEMRAPLVKCRKFWAKKDDDKTKDFLKRALDVISGDKFYILRISDFNTTGLSGAFDTDDFTPWKSLVQGNSYSVKASDSAAGSFGIGKAAPFIVSELQTVFYRTIDGYGVTAAQGVARLVSFKDDNADPEDNTVRHSTGYYGSGNKNMPLKAIPQLDAIRRRTERGTDLFIPAFRFAAGKSPADWIPRIVIAILDNFLYSIFSGKLEVCVSTGVNKVRINQETLEDLIGKYSSKYSARTKNASSFLSVIKDSPDVIEEIKPFHGMGDLRLRVLYSGSANKKVLVVRNSGMKITDIRALPKGISFVGFLELRGEELNKFFRGMENPKHNQWEYKRHSDPAMAKQYKEEVEKWVREFISDKIKEISGEETDIDVSAYFMASEKNDPEQKEEGIIDSVKSIDIVAETPAPKSFKVRDIGGTQGRPSGSRMKPGIIDDMGSAIGHRRRTGTSSDAQPTGRKGTAQSNGDDKVYDRTREVNVWARIIKHSGGSNKMIFKAADSISAGELEIVAAGDNEKPLRMVVKSVKGIDVDAVETDGRIRISNVDAGKKYRLEFEVYAERTYAMKVRAYGN